LLNRVFRLLQPAIRDAAVTVGSTRLQLLRRTGEYFLWKRRYREWRGLGLAELLRLQKKRLDELLGYAAENSAFYRAKVPRASVYALADFPILEKAQLHENIDSLLVGPKGKLIPGFTGGTTGRGITVYSRKQDLQQRFAILDLFWEMHGFRLGRDKIAWFSGRKLVWDADAQLSRFWRNNWLYKIRYYSTFHMSPERLGIYTRDLCGFKPSFLSGFPSAMAELARFIVSSQTSLPFQPKTIFVTSETLTPDQRDVIENAFGCKVRNQYCASEGTPFVVECPAGNLHLDLSTGVLEVVDENGRPSDEGEMLVTPFFTTGTPIIRYRIGDRIKMSGQRKCSCGWDTPMVDAIQGRATDYIEVPGRGKIFASQIGDCVKGVSTVLKFQVEMNNGALHVYLVADGPAFDAKDKRTFLDRVQERMGDVPVVFHFVRDLLRTPSGKHTVVKPAAHP
jgi:phenylacetate-CoA ligase